MADTGAMLVIFNGGKASRMGGVDKGQVLHNGQSLFAQTRSRFIGLHDHGYVSVSAQYTGTQYEGFPVIYDDAALLPAGSGVITSVLSCLKYAAQAGYPYFISAPVDTPSLSATYCADLRRAWRGGDVPVVVTTRDGEDAHLHPLHALWPVAALPKMMQFACDEGLRKMTRFHEVLTSHTVTYAAHEMTNINSPQDLQRATDDLR